MAAIRAFRAAQGLVPAHLLLCGAMVLDVFSGEFRTSDVAVADGLIVGFGVTEAEEIVDLSGAWLVPGFIDAHVHLESSRLSPPEFARAVLPHGTTAVIADPHETANVLGVRGIRYMLETTEGRPLRVFFMAPSGVPASPLETAGAELGAREVAQVLSWPRLLGPGEVMNFPAVLAHDPEVWEKLRAAEGRPVDGHAPGLRGPEL